MSRISGRSVAGTVALAAIALGGGALAISERRDVYVTFEKTYDLAAQEIAANKNIKIGTKVDLSVPATITARTQKNDGRLCETFLTDENAKPEVCIDKAGEFVEDPKFRMSGRSKYELGFAKSAYKFISDPAMEPGSKVTATVPAEVNGRSVTPDGRPCVTLTINASNLPQTICVRPKGGNAVGSTTSNLLQSMHG